MYKHVMHVPMHAVWCSHSCSRSVHCQVFIVQRSLLNEGRKDVKNNRETALIMTQNLITIQPVIDKCCMNIACHRKDIAR